MKKLIAILSLTAAFATPLQFDIEFVSPAIYDPPELDTTVRLTTKRGMVTIHPDGKVELAEEDAVPIAVRWMLKLNQDSGKREAELSQKIADLVVEATILRLEACRAPHFGPVQRGTMTQIEFPRKEGRSR